MNLSWKTSFVKSTWKVPFYSLWKKSYEYYFFIKSNQRSLVSGAMVCKIIYKVPFVKISLKDIFCKKYLKSTFYPLWKKSYENSFFIKSNQSTLVSSVMACKTISKLSFVKISRKMSFVKSTWKESSYPLWKRSYNYYCFYKKIIGGV